MATAIDGQLERLQQALETGGPAALMSELETQVRGYGMLDGRVIDAETLAELKQRTFEFLRGRALPTVPVAAALRLLDLLLSYGYAELEPERDGLAARLRRDFPPPPAATQLWESFRTQAAELHAPVSQVGAPLSDAYFVEAWLEQGVRLPLELIRLYAACDGFELTSRRSAHLPVFGLLEVRSLDFREEEVPFSARAGCFHGGDNVLLSVYVDEASTAWLVYEYGPEPIAQVPLQLAQLLGFAVARAGASEAQLAGELSWEAFFETAEVRVDDLPDA